MTFVWQEANMRINNGGHDYRALSNYLLCTSTCIYCMCVYMYMNVCKCIYVCVNMYICTCTCVYMYVYNDLHV